MEDPNVVGFIPQGEWPRKFAVGETNPDTNEFRYSVPRRDRLNGIIELLKKNDFYPWAVTYEHMRSLESAERTAAINGYALHTDISLASGLFRGFYINTSEADRPKFDTFIMANHVPGESLIRIRQGMLSYWNQGVDGMGDERARRRDVRPNDVMLRDGWAAIEAIKGYLFQLEDRKSLYSNAPIGDFELNSKGTRIISFTAPPLFGGGDLIEYVRCGDYADPKMVMRWLNAIQKPEFIREYSALARA
ncbi:hypothetical protein [Pyruvatibacter mobilis]|uniref:hypothetical protein n=1 Tax=Pyruvatibacter mobilis TaxID=1712261 RepID=UPI003C7A43D7